MQVSISIIEQAAHSDPQTENVQQLPIHNEVSVLEECTQQLQQPAPLRRSTRERRSATSDDFIVFLQEHEENIGIMEDDSINFGVIF